MENKYYTPTIDEFYVGFEYEYNRFNVDLYKQDTENLEFLPTNTWVKKTVGSNFILCYSAEYLKQNLLRVKYLDKTDIESLGFVDIHKGTDRSSIDRCYKYQLRKIVSNKYEPIPTYRILCNLHYYPDKPGIIYIGGLCDFKIKNKSELVKLLKMLGINE